MLKPTQEICSCCGIVCNVKYPACFQPYIYLDGARVPACYSCCNEALVTDFRMVFGLRYGTERTNTGDQRTKQTMRKDIKHYPNCDKDYPEKSENDNDYQVIELDDNFQAVVCGHCGAQANNLPSADDPYWDGVRDEIMK